jgi:hypothetical protein
VLAASAPEEFSVPVLVAAAGVAIVWWLVLGAVIVARRPPRIAAVGAGGLALPPEPPAVAGILAGDFDVAGETAPAVLLDLTARGFVSLDEVQPGRTVCRLRATRASGADEPLTDYEHRVLAELQTKAIDGIVPADALTTGPEVQSKRWHRELAREVVADAQQRGLTRERWSRPIVSAFGVGLVAIIVILFLSAQTGGDAADDDTAIVGAIAAAIAIGTLLGGLWALARLGSSIAQLPTAEGREAAARVVGLATSLRDNDALGDLPPAGVKLWDRLFAYAAVFGAAPLAVALLPMGAEDDHRAWSHVGGRWRTVKVRYPRAWPPAWGKHPVLAIALALLWGAVAGVVGYGLLQVTSTDRPLEIARQTWDWVELAAALALVPVVAVLAWAAWVLVRSLPDLWQTRTVVGDIVRDRKFRQVFSSGANPDYWNYLAVDDGTSDAIAAYRVSDALSDGRSQGESVTAEITPRLGYVRSMTVRG